MRFSLKDKVKFKNDPRCIVYDIVEIHLDTLQYYLETDNPDGKSHLFLSFNEENKLEIVSNLSKKPTEINITIIDELDQFTGKYRASNGVVYKIEAKKVY